MFIASSAVNIRLAMPSRERVIVTVYQSVGPSYLGIGAVLGYNS